MRLFMFANFWRFVLLCHLKSNKNVVKFIKVEMSRALHTFKAPVGCDICQF